MQDRSGEQDSAPPLCCPVPAVTDSSSSQLSQDSAAISLPKSIPGVERLDFDPPTHPSVSPNTGRLNIPEITPHPSPASSAGYSWLFGESSEPSSLLQYSPLPNPSSLRSIPAIVVNPSLPSRPHSAPASPTLSRSVLPKFPSHYRKPLSGPIKYPSPIHPLKRQQSPFLGGAGQSNFSLDWDNYASDPSYLHRPSQTIPVINTPSSSLEPSPGRLSDFLSPIVTSTPDMATPQQMAAESRKMQLAVHSLKALIRTFPPDLMTLDRMESYNTELKEIRDKFLEFSTLVMTYSMTFLHCDDPPKSLEGAAMDVEFWSEAEKEIQTVVNTHQLQIRQIASDLHKNKGMSEFERQDLELKKKQIELLENSSAKAVEEEKEKAKANAQDKYDEILAIGVEMDEFLDQVEDWDKATRAEVITAMKDLDKWGDKFCSLNKAYRGFCFATSKYMQPDMSDKVEELMEDTTVRYKQLVEDVKGQDKSRELYSLAGANSEQVKLPRFSGNPGEDFLTFKKKLLLAFEKNRVPVSDKIEKLRACLSGEALALVPEKSKEFNDAIANLEKAYGNTENVLQSRMLDLKRLGRCPPEILNGKRNFAAIVSFCLKLEVLIQDIVDMAEQDGHEHLQHDAYSTSTRQTIQQLFSLKEEKKLRGLSGRGKAGLLEHLKFIVKLRADAQTMVDHGGGTDAKAETKGDTDKKAGKGGGDKAFPGVVNFGKPKKFDECRVCGQLEATGKTNLFENHTSNFVTGCPSFQAMTADDRRDICLKAKICLKCADPKVIHSAQHWNDCKIDKKKKFWFTCSKHPKCLQHSWMCGYHKADNKSLLEEFSKRNNIHPPINLTVVEAATTTNDNPSSVAEDGGVRAMKNMKRNLKKKGTEVLDLPEGDSVFLLAPLKGVTRPVMGFFDSGCSDAVLKHGVPGKELHGVCTNGGPIPMQGVGGVVVHAREEWIVRMKRKDGRVQLLKGFTMDMVCAAMPKVNTEKAVEEIKNTSLDKLQPGVKLQLSNCKVPAEVGGEIDAIIGIKYNNISPTPIHTLECGLTIYSLALETHNPEYNAVIGGPHKSFSFLLNQTGGLSQVQQTLQILHSALDNYHKFGPPKISNFAPSDKTMKLAKSWFASEFELTAVQGINTFNDDEHGSDDLGESDDEEEVSEPLNCQVDFAVADLPCVCTACYHSFLTDDDKLRDMKHWLKQLEGGVTVEYRCPACRECPRCRDADTTEKISMREEVEQKAIEDSVTLDMINNRIVVTLPKRGKEEQFLSSNRDIALKVLDGVCKKASKNETTKLEISKAFDKLFNNGHAVFIDELSEDELEQFTGKAVQFYLPWRVVYKLDSLSTPVRPVFDASTNTRRRRDGSGGRSLNDLLCKGKVDTLNLLKMVVRFMIGSYALAGDFRQFYCSCKLVPEDFNLVRFLYRADLDPSSVPREAVFKALIFGLKCASGQSECSKCKLAKHCQLEFPVVATLLEEGTYVDDMGESKATAQEIDKLIEDADNVFSQVGLECKDWNKTNKKPSDISSSNGVSIFVGGTEWCPEVDSVSVKIPLLHFGKKKRGKLDDRTEFFMYSGDFSDKSKLDNFCPKLTRRMCASKAASVFDLTGLLAPVLVGVKCLMRDTVKATNEWDQEIPDILRNKWLDAFLTLEKLRGIKFDRPIMPLNAVNKNLRLIALSDAGQAAIMVGVWGGFLLPNGNYSCRLIIGRSLLSADTTIPKLELEGANSVANLGWFVRMCLKDWPISLMQGCDSTIALCWITSEELRLSQFHRNRVGQIRRALGDLDHLYHVRTDVMAADCGTRPDKVGVQDILVGSRWHSGEPWMTWPIQKAIDEGCIKSVSELRLNDEEKEEFQDGVIFERMPELITRGHTVNQVRVTEIEKRAKFSNYVLLPTKFGFKKFIGVMVIVIKFLVRCRKGKPFTGPLLSAPMDKIPALLSVSHQPASTLAATDPLSLEDMNLQEKCLKLVATYLFRTTTVEVKEFSKKSIIDKQGVEIGGIIFSKNRLLEALEFKKVTGMEMVNLDPLGVNVQAPILDRYSPVAYSLAQHIHWDVSKHAGLETCNRLCLERVHILQGFAILKELSNECALCKVKRKKFLEVSTGPVGEHQLNIAPAMYACQADLFGPVTVYVPGYSKALRGRPALASQVWVMVFVCPVTRLVNCQVIEKSDHGGILDGVTRLAADYGFPKYLMIDQDDAIMKALRESEVCLRNLQHSLYTEHGVIFTTCPVGGHNMHGHVERTIKTIQEMLDSCGLKTRRLHATGLQTLLKLTENNYNSLPLGYKYDRSITNTPLLKIITPNFFKMGRNNNRALDGPLRVPGGGGELLKNINDMYDGIFKLWADTYVPKLIYQPTKWNKDDQELHVGDLVYFQKEPDKKLPSKWIIGMIDELDRGRDGKVRKVIVKYQNHGENQPRLTERSTRSLVKIFDIEEYVLQEDLAEVMQRLLRPVDEQDQVDIHVDQVHVGKTQLGHATDEQLPLDQDGAGYGQVSPSCLWLEVPVEQDHPVSQRWEDKSLTFKQSSGLASVLSGTVQEKYGDAVETILSPTLLDDLHAAVGPVEGEAAAKDGVTLDLIQMIRSTSINISTCMSHEIV